MKLTDQRLDEILNQLRQDGDVSAAKQDEWLSIAQELKALRLRTSSQSRTASGPGGAPGAH